MKLDPKSWYVKWFFWSCRILDAFSDRPEDSEHWENSCAYFRENGTNLCQFMRIILVWTPIVLIFHLALLGALIYALAVQPITLFGSGTWFKIVTFLGCTIGFIFLISFTVKGLLKILPSMDDDQKPKPVRVKVKKEKPPSGPSFREVFWKWIVAQKQKICPLITFREYNAQSGKAR